MWNVVGVLPVSPAPQGHLTADVPVEMMSVPGNARLDALVMSPTRMFRRALLRGLLAVWCTAAPSAGLWGGKATVHCATGHVRDFCEACIACDACELYDARALCAAGALSHTCISRCCGVPPECDPVTKCNRMYKCV